MFLRFVPLRQTGREWPTNRWTIYRIKDSSRGITSTMLCALFIKFSKVLHEAVFHEFFTYLHSTSKKYCISQLPYVQLLVWNFQKEAPESSKYSRIFTDVSGFHIFILFSTVFQVGDVITSKSWHSVPVWILYKNARSGIYCGKTLFRKYWKV